MDGGGTQSAPSAASSPSGTQIMCTYRQCRREKKHRTKGRDSSFLGFLSGSEAVLLEKNIFFELQINLLKVRFNTLKSMSKFSIKKKNEV